MKIIDLSITLENNMVTYPGDPKVSIKQVHNLEIQTWNLLEISMSSHSGTHVDAFSHMVKDGLTIDKIPLESFINKAYLVKEEDTFPENSGLVLDFYGDINILDKIIAVKAKFVAGNISEDLERGLLKASILTYTGLINIDKLPYNKDFLFIGLPLKIKYGDGSPVRCVAILDY